MTRILVTGAAGFTGRTLVPLLLEKGFDVIPMDRLSTGFSGEIIADLSDDGLIKILSTLPSIDVVVHLGTRVGWDGGTSADLFKPNVLATGILAGWAQGQGAHFIFASAALIAGERTTHITSESQLNTSNDYLYGKWLAEELIRISGVRHTFLRISGIFGKGGPFHLGLNRAIASALEGKPPIQMGDGQIKRNYIYVKDLCEVILHCIYSIKTSKPVEGVHLVGGREGITIARMLQDICDILLPGTAPEVREWNGGYDQIVDVSPLLPEGRAFRDAITDIRAELNKVEIV